MDVIHIPGKMEQQICHAVARDDIPAPTKKTAATSYHNLHIY